MPKNTVTLNETPCQEKFCPLVFPYDMGYSDSAMTEREWITPKEAATLFRVSYRTIKRWVKQGKLPHVKIDRAIRIDKHVFDLCGIEKEKAPPLGLGKGPDDAGSV